MSNVPAVISLLSLGRKYQDIAASFLLSNWLLNAISFFSNIFWTIPLNHKTLPRAFLHKGIKTQRHEEFHWRHNKLLLGGWRLQVASWVQKEKQSTSLAPTAKIHLVPGETNPVCVLAALCESCIRHCRSWISVTGPWELLCRVVHLCSRQADKQPRSCINPSSPLGVQLHLEGKEKQKAKEGGDGEL